MRLEGYSRLIVSAVLNNSLQDIVLYRIGCNMLKACRNVLLLVVCVFEMKRVL